MTIYSQCKVYKLTAKAGVYADDEEQPFYIGSTCKPRLCQRMTWHRSDAKTGTSNVYQWMRDIGAQNVEISLLQAYPECTSFDEQRKFEREWVDRLQPSLNMSRPYVTKEEARETVRDWYNENKDARTKYYRKWREENNHVLVEKRREYYQLNRDALLEKRRVYRENNKDVLVEKGRVRGQVYRERNREAINARNRARYALKKAQAELQASQDAP